MKRTVTWLAFAFLVFWLLTQPQQFADGVIGVGEALQWIVERVIAFFEALTP